MVYLEELMKFEDVVDIIEKPTAVVFTTVNEKDGPESRALLNLANKQLYPGLTGKAISIEGNRITLYFTTNTSSRKIGQIHANPKAALYFCIPEKMCGVGLCGIMEEITDQKIKTDFWQPGWDIYYHEGASDPDYALIKFVSEDIRSWYNSAKHVFGTTSSDKAD
jgi:general stress protein 26